MVLQAHKALQVPMVLLELKDRKVLKAQWVLKARKATKVLPVHKALPVLMALQAHKVRKVLKALWVLKVLKV
jgi:hypothetical protein